MYRSSAAQAAGAATDSRSARPWAAARQWAISLASCLWVASVVSSATVFAIATLRLGVAAQHGVRSVVVPVVVARPHDELSDGNVAVKRSTRPRQLEREHQA